METGILNRKLTIAGKERKYAIYIPDSYNGQPMPAILHLHGMGESGTDGLFQLWHGIPRNIIRHQDRWPFVVICPQKAKHEELWDKEVALLDGVLAAAEKELKIDPHRRYLTGLSQGGRGTMLLAKKLSWQFAAIAPVCGWSDDPAATAKELGDIPVWLFHGEKDPAVPVDGSKRLAAELEKLGKSPKLTLYPDVGHNAWDFAYDDPELPKWFLGHSLD